MTIKREPAPGLVRPSGVEIGDGSGAKRIKTEEDSKLGIKLEIKKEGLKVRSKCDPTAIPDDLFTPGSTQRKPPKTLNSASADPRVKDEQYGPTAIPGDLFAPGSIQRTKTSSSPSAEVIYRGAVPHVIFTPGSTQRGKTRNPDTTPSGQKLRNPKRDMSISKSDTSIATCPEALPFESRAKNEATKAILNPVPTTAISNDNFTTKVTASSTCGDTLETIRSTTQDLDIGIPATKNSIPPVTITGDIPTPSIIPPGTIPQTPIAATTHAAKSSTASITTIPVSYPIATPAKPVARSKKTRNKPSAEKIRRRTQNQRDRRTAKDRMMAETILPLRKNEIMQLLSLGTDEAKAAAEKMQKVDIEREELLKKWANTSFLERMSKMTQEEKEIHEEYRNEYEMQKSKKNAYRTTVEQGPKAKARGKSKESQKENSNPNLPKKPPMPRESLTERLARTIENRRLFREDHMGAAYGLAKRLHDKRFENTQRDGPYNLRSKGSPSTQLGGEQLEQIEDVMAGVGYAAWRMNEDPEIFKEYHDAETNLSPPPSPRTASMTWNKIMFGRMKGIEDDIDDVYYDFWAKETYARPIRDTNAPPQHQPMPAPEENESDDYISEADRIHAPDDGDDYEEPEFEPQGFENLINHEIIDIESSSESEDDVGNKSKNLFSNVEPIVIDDSSDEVEEGERPPKAEAGNSDDTAMSELAKLSTFSTFRPSTRRSENRHNSVKREKSETPTSKPATEGHLPVKIKMSESPSSEPVRSSVTRKSTNRKLMQKEELFSPEPPIRRGGRKRSIKDESDSPDAEPVLRGRKRLLRSETASEFEFKIDSDDDEEVMVMKQLLNKPRSLRSSRKEAEHIFLL